MANRKTFIACMLLCIFLQGGCALITRHREIATLSGLSDAQGDIAQFVKRQDDGFAHLLGDIQNNRLEKGISKNLATSRYGEPITCGPAQGTAYREACLYRKSTQYFNTDMVYLYFDEEAHLADWKLQPANCPAGEE